VEHYKVGDASKAIHNADDTRSRGKFRMGEGREKLGFCYVERGEGLGKEGLNKTTEVLEYRVLSGRVFLREEDE